jgi:PAS domain S-box-containing protein
MGVAGLASDQQQLLAMVEAEVGALLEYLPVPLVVTSRTGDVLRANPTAEMLLGSSRETLVGKQIDHLLRRNDISARVRTLCHAGEVMRLYVLQHTDGLRAS